jgi:hypothetical protein
MHETPMSKILELYGISTQLEVQPNWEVVLSQEQCPYLNRKCLKVRKSAPDITIGTCSVLYGRDQKKMMICPYRLLERHQIFTDCLQLLTLHEPGNELHIVSEVTIPGGHIDYFLLSVKDEKVKDFVGVELQTLDTTGTAWPERQKFLQGKSLKVTASTPGIAKGFGMNWKMTAKTTLVQLHHKVETFENINKRLVLVIQDYLLDYMRKAFQFDHLRNARIGDAMHIHTYKLKQIKDGAFRLEFDAQFSTDAAGIAKSLGLQSDPNVELEEIIELLESKLSDDTLFTLQ